MSIDPVPWMQCLFSANIHRTVDVYLAGQFWQTDKTIRHVLIPEIRASLTDSINEESSTFIDGW